MLRPRVVGPLVVLAVSLSVACGPVRDAAEEVGQAASELATDAASELESVGPGAGDSAAPTDATESSEGDGGTTAPPDAGGGTDTDAPAGASTPADDHGPVGANAPAMLRGDRASLVVEVDVQQGLAPSDAALQHMVDQLAANADKPGGIRFEGGNSFASDRTAWTTADLRAVVDANRSTATTADAASLYILYVRGGFHADGQETPAVGVTFDASDIAVFPERWSGLGSLVGGGARIERAVLTHELGHALALVNLGYDSAIDHEDPDHPGHSKNRGSVMFWAVETDLIGQVFDGPPPDAFDADDRADLEGLRTGRYRP